MARVILNNSAALKLPIADLKFSDGTTGTKTESGVNYTVELSGADSTSENGAIVLYKWERRVNGGDWNELDTITANTLSELISVTALYEYRLQVTDIEEQISAFSNVVGVNFTASGAQNPIAIIGTGPSAPDTITIEENLNVTLLGIHSQDPDPNTVIESYFWNVSQAPTGSNHTLNQAGNSIAELSNLSVGTYVVALEVINTAGLTDTDLLTIRVTEVDDSGGSSDNGSPSVETDTGCQRRYAGTFTAGATDSVTVNFTNVSNYNVTITHSGGTQLLSTSGAYNFTGTISYDTGQMPDTSDPTTMTIQFENTTTPESSAVFNISAEQTANPC